MLCFHQWVISQLAKPFTYCHQTDRGGGFPSQMKDTLVWLISIGYEAAKISAHRSLRLSSLGQVGDRQICYKQLLGLFRKSVSSTPFRQK